MTAATIDSGSTYAVLPLDRVQPDPTQPRELFDQAKLEELAASIRKHGVRTPIQVRPLGDDRYIIVAGERRYRASLLAEQETIPATIDQSAAMEDPRLVHLLQVVENTGRHDMTEIEEGRAFDKIATDFDWTDAEVGQHAGVSASYVAQRRQLLRLDPRLQDLAHRGKLPSGAAWYLARLSRNGQFEVLAKAKTPDDMQRIARMIYDRENAPEQSAMFAQPDEKQLEQRRRTRARATQAWERIEGLTAPLAQLEEITVDDLAAALAGDLGLWVDRLDALEKAVRRAKLRVADARAKAIAEEVIATEDTSTTLL